MQIYVGDGAARIWLCRGVFVNPVEVPMFSRNAGRILGEMVPIVGATKQKLRTWGNRAEDVVFSVDREHADMNTASNFLWSHKRAVLGLRGTFVFLSEDGSSQASSTLLGAVVEFDGQQTGKSTVVTYTLIGN